MTAAELAARVQARPAGSGRWLARCPAHNDHTPSLSIREGDDGRVLLLCRTGCRTEAVLSALGLTWRDVCGTQATPADRARMARERAERERAEAAERRRHAALADLLRRSDDAMNALAAQVAAALFAGELGDADLLADRYHGLLSVVRDAEAAHAA